MSTPRPLRFWQFRLRTLLIAAAVIPATIGGGVWWVTAPMKTWREFCARVEARDLAGANALCGPNLRIVEGDSYAQSALGDSSVKQLPLKFLRDCYDGQVAPRDTPESLTGHRTWEDILFGRVTTRMGIDYDVEKSEYWSIEIHSTRVVVVRMK